MPIPRRRFLKRRLYWCHAADVCGRGLHLDSASFPFRRSFPAPQFPTTTTTQRAGAIGTMDRGQWMAASRAATASLDGSATFPSGSSGDAWRRDDGEVLRSP